MKKILLVVVLFCTITNIKTEAQNFKIETGIVNSNMEHRFDLFTDYKKGIFILMGLDYMEHKNFCISSQLGYVSAGGRQKIFNYNGEESRYLKLSTDNIHLNTSFRFKFPMDKLTLFIGVGPKLDLQVGYKLNTTTINDPGLYSIDNKLFWGVKPDAGFYYQIKDFKLGLTGSYSYDFNETSNKLRNKKIMVGISLGYKMSNKK